MKNDESLSWIKIKNINIHDKIIFSLKIIDKSWNKLPYWTDLIKNKSKIVSFAWCDKHIFFLKRHTRFRASEITMESITSVVFFGKFFTVEVSHCLPLDLLKRLSFLTKIKIVLNKARFDPEQSRSEFKCMRHFAL